jgi:hypothetical protein
VCPDRRTAVPSIGARIQPVQHDEPVGVQAPQRLRAEVWPAVPWHGAGSSDLTGADGLSVVLMLDLFESAEHDSLLNGHRHANLVGVPGG